MILKYPHFRIPYCGSCLQSGLAAGDWQSVSRCWWGKPTVTASRPLPVGFPHQHQGYSDHKEVPLEDMFICRQTTLSRPQTCASTHSFCSTLNWELLWGRPRLLTDCQSPAAEARLETAATLTKCQKHRDTMKSFRRSLNIFRRWSELQDHSSQRLVQLAH